MDETEPQEANSTDAVVDDELEQATQLLGTPEAVFRADGRRRRISIWLGLGLIVYAILANYVWWMHVRRGGFGHLEFYLLVMPLAIGIGLLAFVYHHRGLRVAVFSTGVLRLRRGVVESVPFDEVQVLRIRTASAEPVIERDESGEITCCFVPIKVPTFRIWDAWIELERTGEQVSKFRAAVGEFPAFAELIQRKVFERLWPSVLELTRTGGSITFDNLSVSMAGVQVVGKELVPWSAIKGIKLENHTVTISRTSGWRAVWTHDLGTLPTPQLLFALLNLYLHQPIAAPE